MSAAGKPEGTGEIDLMQAAVDYAAAYSAVGYLISQHVANIHALVEPNTDPRISVELRAISSLTLTIKKAEMDMRSAQAAAQANPVIDVTTTEDAGPKFLRSSF